MATQNDYLKWKRKNVTLRGINNADDLNVPNGGGSDLGDGLYTAFLSNKQMAKGYGKVYFVVNAIPQKPKIFNTKNDWEIWCQNNLYYPVSKKKGRDYPDRRDFEEVTDIRTEMLKLKFDGVIIKGREMVHFNPPKDIRYFKTEDDLKDYYFSKIANESSMSKFIIFLNETTKLNESLEITDDTKLNFEKIDDNKYKIQIIVDGNRVTYQFYNKDFGFWKKVMRELSKRIINNNKLIYVFEPIDFGFAKKYFSQTLLNDKIEDNYDEDNHVYTIKYK